MTIKEAQDLVRIWNGKNSQNKTGTTYMEDLSSEVAGLSRAVTGSPDEDIRAVSQGISQSLWTLLSLAAYYGIDLTEGLIENLANKNRGK